jgi:hypothetical protein
MAFALSPAEAINGVIDYTTNEGRKIYASAIRKVDEELYDCKQENLFGFLRSVSDRAIEYGWEDNANGVGIIHIPNPNNEDQLDNLLTNYGEVYLEAVRAHESTYINGDTREAQNTNMLYKCLMASMSKEAKKKIQIWEDHYNVDGMASGVSLLKVIIRESYLDTIASSNMCRLALSNLDKYILTIGSDIEKFNAYVKTLLNSLKARGERTEDLMVNLFKGYLNASDKAFVAYIEKKKDDWEDDTAQFTVDSLMLIAVNKFGNLKATGGWNAPSAEEEKILALQVEVRRMMKKGSCLTL